MNDGQVWHGIYLALLLMEMLICKTKMLYFIEKKSHSAQENATSNQFNFFFKQKNLGHVYLDLAHSKLISIL